MKGKTNLQRFLIPVNRGKDIWETVQLLKSSNGLFLKLKNDREKIVPNPTYGSFCSTVIWRRKPQIKLQCMIPIDVDEDIEEMCLWSSLIYPRNLCDSFIQ